MIRTVSPLASALTALLIAALLAGCPTDETPGTGGGDAAVTDGSGDTAGGDSEDGIDADSTGESPDVVEDTTDPIDPGLLKCETDADCKGSKPICAPVGFCVGCINATHCDADEVCDGGTCKPDGCTPNASRCQGSALLTCNAEGTFETPVPCTKCTDGACAECNPGAKTCIGAKAVQCKPDGSGYKTQFLCGEGQICVEGACFICYPGTTRCQNGLAQTCSIQGKWVTSEDCEAVGYTCELGACQSTCLIDQKSSNIGCDYWAADLDNAEAAQVAQYAVIVSNLHETDSAKVSVSVRDDATSAAKILAQRTVPPGGLEVIKLPRRDMGGTGLEYKAYRIRSTSPIVAYQFNPLDNEDVFSNDASLLLPVNALGTSYVAVSRFEVPTQGGKFRGFVAISGTAQKTTVTVRPTATTLAGGGIPAMMAGEESTFELAPYQLLMLKSNQVGGDLTGTMIKSDNPIAVWSGHEAAVSGDVCCADHLEHQLFPNATLGKEYIAVKSMPRGKESDYWRVVAAKDGTVVTFEPSTIGAPKTLDAGEWFEIKTDQDFRITATEPVSVSQTLASSQEVLGDSFDPSALCSGDADCPDDYTCLFGQCAAPTCTQSANTCPPGHACSCQLFVCNCAPIGDPTLILTPPVEQFRDDYVFLVPADYAENFITITAPSDSGDVMVDGSAVAVELWSPVGVTGYRAARMPIVDGVHRVSAAIGVGLVVYGYHRDVSYGYTGGLNLEDL